MEDKPIPFWVNITYRQAFKLGLSIDAINAMIKAKDDSVGLKQSLFILSYFEDEGNLLVRQHKQHQVITDMNQVSILVILPNN